MKRIIVGLMFMMTGCVHNPFTREPKLEDQSKEVLTVKWMGTMKHGDRLYVCGFRDRDMDNLLCVDYEYFMERLMRGQPTNAQTFTEK